jgi:hypothetical protein
MIWTSMPSMKRDLEEACKGERAIHRIHVESFIAIATTKIGIVSDDMYLSDT